MNPIMQTLNRSGQVKMPMRSNDPFQMIQQFQQFAKNMSPQQAQKMIEQKLQSGEITPQQLESAKHQAMQFAKMLGIK